jgi:hypothetical protein
VEILRISPPRLGDRLQITETPWQRPTRSPRSRLCRPLRAGRTVSNRADEQLRQRLHELVDRMIDEDPNPIGPDLEWATLQLAGRLLKSANPFIDREVGQYLADSKHPPTEWQRLGEQAREAVTAAISGDDAPALGVTPRVGVLAAEVTIGCIGVVSRNPYLQVLSEALRLLRFRQIHPWLVPPKAPVHPPQHAYSVLRLKAIPFCVVEYLVASGAYPTKRTAQQAVLERLGKAEETLKDWRKIQNRTRRIDFKRELVGAASAGKAKKLYRSSGTMDPLIDGLIEEYDEIYGLAAVDRCAAALRALGADKGRKA